MSESVEYQITITRSNNTEFQANYTQLPEDDFGKALVAHMLIRIAEKLNPNLIAEAAPQVAEAAPGGDGE